MMMSRHSSDWAAAWVHVAGKCMGCSVQVQHIATQGTYEIRTLTACRLFLLTSKEGHHTQTLQPVVLWQKAQQSPWLNF